METNNIDYQDIKYQIMAKKLKLGIGLENLINEKIKNSNSTSTTDSYSCNYANNNFLSRTLWSGDIVPTALNNSVGDSFSSESLRPYQYKICYARFNIDGTYFLLPFRATDYAVGTTHCGYWCISSSTNAYLTFFYGGYGSFSFQVKEIHGKTLSQVHLYEIIGIK